VPGAKVGRGKAGGVRAEGAGAGERTRPAGVRERRVEGGKPAFARGQKIAGA